MYRYELSNNHYIIDINNKKYLLDTGSPFSFYINDECKSLEIDGVKYHLHNTPSNLDINETTKLVGVSVDGFIGLDIVYQTSLTIYKNGLVDFCSHDVDGNTVTLKTFPLLSFQVGFNLMSGNCIIDTGAKYGYGIKGLFYNKIPYNRVNDYNPILKHLSSDVYHLDVVVGGTQKQVDICDNYLVAPTLKSVGAIMICNITSLFDEVCVIDIDKGLLTLK